MRYNLSPKFTAVPAVSSPPAPATPESPKVLAGAAKVEDDGVGEGGVADDVGTAGGDGSLQVWGLPRRSVPKILDE